MRPDSSTTAESGSAVEALLYARSAAVVGASPERRYSTMVLGNLRRFGLAESDIFLVNPRYERIGDKKCYPGLRSLPQPVELVVVLLAAERVPAVVDEAIASGAKAMLLVSDGFAETGAGGLQMQDDIARRARAAGLAVLGPNSLGYFVPAGGAGAWAGGEIKEGIRAGNVALAFQSSGMLNVVLGQLSAREIGVSAAVSVGNEALLDLADFIQHFARHEPTKVIAIVSESSSRPRALADAMLAARRAGKLLIVLSIGKSARGMQNVRSHAGRMAGAADGWLALYRQVGAIVVHELADLVEIIELASKLKPGADISKLAIVTNSGGDCGMICDLAELLDVSLAEVTDATQALLDQRLARSHILANPLDVRNTRMSAPDVFWDSVGALAADPGVEVLAVRLDLAPAPGPQHRDLYGRLARLADEAGCAFVVMSRVPEVSSPEWYRLFADLGVPFLTTYGGALRAARALQSVARSVGVVDNDAEFSGLPQTPPGVRTARPVDIAPTVAWLREHGVPYVESVLASSTDEAVDAAAKLGFPVVMKGHLPGLAHKTDESLVRLGVGGADQARAVAAELWDRLSTLPHGMEGCAQIEVQQQVSGAKEAFVGCHTDPVLGPVLSFGLGGLFLETFRDVCYAIPPISTGQAEACLRQLRSWPVLSGTRGEAPSDIAALSALISAVSRAVASSDSIGALDLNPVMVSAAGQGVVAVDAYYERDA